MTKADKIQKIDAGLTLALTLLTYCTVTTVNNSQCSVVFVYSKSNLPVLNKEECFLCIRFGSQGSDTIILKDKYHF